MHHLGLTGIEPAKILLNQLRQLAQKLGVIGIANVVLEDERFPVWTGSSKPIQHHYGTGGLIQHTYEVVQLCRSNNEWFSQLGKSVHETQLFLAALFHDAGKMWDHEPVGSTIAADTEWHTTVHKREIHHISRSAFVWQQASSGYTLDWNTDDVLHAILAHHGLREWGSPVMPNTRLAWMLHLCDGLSARMDDGDRLFNHLPPK